MSDLSALIPISFKKWTQTSDKERKREKKEQKKRENVRQTKIIRRYKKTHKSCNINGYKTEHTERSAQQSNVIQWILMWHKNESTKSK